MKSPPLVSIVMCTYNGAKYIDEQLESVFKQDHPLYEIVIVDDCSQDNTFDKLSLWAAKYNNIRLYRNEENIGINKNFEKAISLSSGDYIAIADQDDVWLPQKITRLVVAFETDETVTLAHCRSATLKDGNIDYSNHKLHRHFSGSDTRKLMFFNHINGHNMMFKKELLSLALPIPDKMFYDWWLAVIATTQGKIAAVNITLVYHRQHGENNFFTNKAIIKKKEPSHIELLKSFLTLPALNTETKKFTTTLLNLMTQQAESGGRFNLKLFRFLFKNRIIIFGHKIRTLPILSYTKNAIKYSKGRSV